MRKYTRTIGVCLLIMSLTAGIAGCGKTVSVTENASGADKTSVSEPAVVPDTSGTAETTKELEPSGQTQGYTPPKNVTWLIAFGAGGGVDTFARAVGNVITVTGLGESNFIYENQTGASGQVGYAVAIEQKAGDESILVPGSSNSLTIPYCSGQKYSYKDLTVVCKLGNDYRMVVTNSASDIKTVEDLVKAGQERQLVCAVNGLGSVAHLFAAEMIETLKIDCRIVPYDGDGDVIAVLGNQVDFTISSPAELLEYVEAGELNGIAVSSTERLSACQEVPTFIEKGYELEQEGSRGVFMAPGVSEEARSYWEGVCEKLVKTPEFAQQYADKYQVQLEFAAGPEYEKELDEVLAETMETMKALGLAK